MANYTMRFTEEYQFGGHLYPANKAVATHNTDWLDMRDHHRAQFIVIVGEMAAGATVDFKLQEATDSDGSGAQDIDGKSITQLTQAGGDANSICVVEIQAEEMDVADDFRYLRGVLTVGSDTAYASVIPLRGPTRLAPVSVTNITEVVD